MSLQHVSLFAGVGGGDLGFHAAGIPTVAAVEIDDQARGVLAHRFPHAALFSDVRKVTGDDLRAAGAVPERTILSGGFPCQPFSVAGARGGMDGDERGDLWWEIVRLLAEFRPRWLVAENVPGLLSIDGGRTMGAILRSLGDSGYGFAYRVLDAQHFGVPQRRRRVFIVGRAGDDRGPVQVLLEPEGRAGNPAAGVASGPGTAPAASGGVARTVTTGTGQRYDADTDDLIVVSALTSNMAGGGGGADDNTAQAGHLVPWVKAARAQSDTDDETWREGDVAPTLNAFDNGSESRATVCVTGTVAHTLRAEGADASEDGTGRGTPIVVTPLALRGRADGVDLELGDEGGPYWALRAGDGGSSRQPLIAFHQTQDPISDTLSPALGATSIGMGVHVPDVRAFTVSEQANSLAWEREVSHTITAQVPNDSSNIQQGVRIGTTVRRLTPVECERLMGWPDGHTAHRVDFRTGRVVPQADSSRYRQCGNGMAAPVVEWIARRIREVEEQ